MDRKKTVKTKKTKKPTKNQSNARKKLAHATMMAKEQYDKLPMSQHSASRWHEMVRRQMAKM